VILDVDNNPDELVRPANARLFSVEGLLRIKQALARDGVLAIWSAKRAPAFEERLCRAEFVFAAREDRDLGHVVYLAHANYPTAA
jgi:hypothetical protein